MDKCKLYKLCCEIIVKFVKRRNHFLGRRKCYICGRTFFSYLPVYGDSWYQEQVKNHGINFHFRDGTYNRWEYRCPYCDSIDRTRFIMAYIHKRFRNKSNMKVLYFAPPPSGVYYLKTKMHNFSVDTNDLYLDDKNIDFHYDIQNMQGINDNTYDVIICSHVLEHVADDRLALKELYRVVKKGGRVLILVPLDLKRVWFDEENGLSESENWKRFGQTDHVRRYTNDEMIKRIQEAGFRCSIVTRSDVSKEIVRQNAFHKNLRIYLAEKEYKNA